MPSPAYVALALTPGIGRARLEALLGSLERPEKVLAASIDTLASVPGMSRAAASAVAARSPRDGERVLEKVAEAGAVALTPADPAFPETLRDIPDAPLLLFVQGHRSLLEGPAVAIVGSRTHSRYGADVCRHLAGGLARAGLVVVSGMARGIDALAHTAALDAGGGTVGVLGNGLGVIYPSANRRLYERMADHACLVTEFPPGERPHAGSFPKRNRLISGLARVTVVVEAREKSGALITVDCALRQGREVMAVPGPVTSPVSLGCNRLIQQGAKPVLGLRDVLEEYGMTVNDAAAATLPTDLSAEERAALSLFDVGDRHVDQLAAGMRCETGDALAVLTSLEIRGLVTQLPGKVFRRAVPMEG